MRSHHCFSRPRTLLGDGYQRRKRRRCTWKIRAASAESAPAAKTSVRTPPPSGADASRPVVEELARLLSQPRAPRLALELTEAAAALGVSKKFFDEHVRHELRLVRRGRKVLVPVRELERWLEENAALTLAGQRTDGFRNRSASGTEAGRGLRGRAPVARRCRLFQAAAGRARRARAEIRECCLHDNVL